MQQKKWSTQHHMTATQRVFNVKIMLTMSVKNVLIISANVIEISSENFLIITNLVSKGLVRLD